MQALLKLKGLPQTLNIQSAMGQKKDAKRARKEGKKQRKYEEARILVLTALKDVLEEWQEEADNWRKVEVFRLFSPNSAQGPSQ